MQSYSSKARASGPVFLAALALILAACVTQTEPRIPPVTGSPTGMSPNGNEPGWRALLIAGDVSSPVFNNAVSASRDRLIALGMSPSRISTLRSGPTHGKPSLKEAEIAQSFSFLRAPAADGCLVFITSHGTRDGAVIWSDSGQLILSPATLEKWLSQVCESKPTITILSACFSGVYTPFLPRTGEHVVFTAASHDRTSFGCSKTGMLNVFDTCLLAAMKEDPTFGELVGETRACVDARERELGVVPSLPQAYVGASLSGIKLGDLL